MLSLENQHKAQHSLDDSMIPAINVVFLLLIFFMIAGHIETHDALLKAPKSISQGEVSRDPIEIRLLADGRQLLHGERIEGPLFDALKVLEVTAQTSLVCHVHKELSVSALDPLLASAKQLGIRRLQIVTEYAP